MKKIILTFLLASTIWSTAYAQPQKCCRQFTNEEAVKVILCVAGDESDAIMMTVACALRNRTSLEPTRNENGVIVETGVSEVNGDISNVPPDIKDRAWKIWMEKSEASLDLSDGAVIWTNLQQDGNSVRPHDYAPDPNYDDYRKPKRGAKTVKFGRHEFYKAWTP